jgi:hypothetical protein
MIGDPGAVNDRTPRPTAPEISVVSRMQNKRSGDYRD